VAWFLPPYAGAARSAPQSATWTITRTRTILTVCPVWGARGAGKVTGEQATGVEFPRGSHPLPLEA
jgi:hypothetical protein